MGFWQGKLVGCSSVTNIEHLALLDASDLLTMRLYVNQDAGNVLWEYAFEYLILESSLIGYNNQTPSTYYVTADEPTVDLKATIAGYATRSPDKKSPVRLNWSTTGGGSFAQTSQADDTLGVFDNTLTMPRIKGTTAQVSVSLSYGAGVDAAANWKTVEVLAGKPHSITYTTEGELVVMGQEQLRIDAYVYDRYNNLVEDGTNIEFLFDNSVRVVEQQLGTINGHAYVVLTGGEFAASAANVTLESNEVTVAATFPIKPLQVELTADKLNLKPGEKAELTARVLRPDGSPASDILVTFNSYKGLMQESNVTTDSNGIARVDYTAGLNPVDDEWVVATGYNGGARLGYRVVPGARSINALDAMLIGDRSTDGTIEYTENAIDIAVGYETQGTVTVSTDMDTEVVLGDMSDPNLEPILMLTLNQLVADGGETTVLDAHGRHPGKAENLLIVHDHPLGAGRSAHFSAADSRVRVPAQVAFNLPDSVGFRLDFKPVGVAPATLQTLLDHGGAQTLQYGNGILRYSVKTDTGNYTLEAPDVTEGQWHRLAVRFHQGQMELMVDDAIYRRTVTGSLVYGSGAAIELGGIDARMRALRLYDWTQAPLIAFEDGQARRALPAGSEVMTVKSLGNLGKAVANSELKQLRVAVIAGDQRNYVSLLTTRGFQEIAQTYIGSVSADSPYSYRYQSNPLPSLFPDAHALSWDGVWDGVKATVGFIIPYEDFIIIGEQLMFLAAGDWGNFQPTELAFAALGAATVIPVAKPLKLVLAPAKKFVKAFEKFPASRHFAGAIGTAAKAAMSGKTDKLVSLLPFLLIGIELYEDQEVFEFIMNAIQSEDDLWVWVEYIAEVVAIEGGLDELVAINQAIRGAGQLVAENPLVWIVPNAQASPRQVIAAKIIKGISKLSKDVKVPNKATKALKEILIAFKDPKNVDLKKLLTNGSAIKYFVGVGSAKIRAFIQSSEKWRVNRWFVLFALGYIAEEVDAGRLQLGSGNRWINLVANVFSHVESRQQGALFQLSQIAYFHIQNQFGVGQPKVMGIELVRPAYALVNGQQVGKPYGRIIDIVLEDSAGEIWVETKSLQGPFQQTWFQNSLAPKSNKDAADALRYRNYFRQYFQDMRLNDDFIVVDPVKRAEILKNPGSKTNAQYLWYFHDYSKKKGVPPTAADITRAQKWLCATPEVINRKDYFEHNLDGSVGEVRSRCALHAVNRIQKRDTKSYIKDVLRPFAQNLGIEDFINLVETFVDDDK